MTFLNPMGLAGLLSLPVILALHLLHRRKKPYIVSHLGLWTFLDAQTLGPNARRIPLTWILLLDLLLGTLLSLAWSQPVIATPLAGRNPQHWVILLDVSSSMRAQDGAGPVASSRFERAKAEAAAILKDVTPKDAVTIITFGRHAYVLADSRPGKSGTQSGAGGIPDLAAKLEKAQAGETGHALLEALSLGQSSLDPLLPAEFHVITDGSFPLTEAEAVNRFAYPLHWHWVGGAAENQAVLDLNVTPLGGNQLYVFTRLANFGSTSVNREAVLSVDGTENNRASIVLPPKSEVAHVWKVRLSAGNAPGSVAVSLSGSDALAADDTAVTGLLPGGKIRVALVADQPGPIEQALRVIPNVDMKIIPPASYAAPSSGGEPGYDLTIFRNFLPETLPSGQVLVVDPPEDNSQAVQNPGILSTGRIRLTTGAGQDIPAGSQTQVSDTNPLVAGIDFSGVRWSRVSTLADSPAGFVPVLQANGVPILLQGNLTGLSGQSGSVTILLADLKQGNFTKHPAFPILIANIVDQARQAPLPLAFKTGEPLPLPAGGSYREIEVTPPGQSPVKIGNNGQDQWTDTLEPGLYRIQLTRNDGSQSEFLAGAQAGDGEESDLNPRNWVQTIAPAGSNTDSSADRQVDRIDLRVWLLSAAVLLFLLEAVLAWRA